MKYMIFKDVVTVQGHGAVLLLQVGSTVLCVGDSGRSNEGAILEIRLFAPLAEKRFTVKWRGLTQRAPDACPYCAGKGEFVNVIGKALRCNHCAGTGQRG